MSPAARVVALAVALLLGALLLVHDVPYLASAAGRCMVQQQPVILVGGSPSPWTEFGCAAAYP